MRKVEKEKKNVDADALARELVKKISALAAPNTASVRLVRKEFSRVLAASPAEVVRELVEVLLSRRNGRLRWVAYELLCHHKQAFAQLDAAELERLGEGLDSWDSVDTFGMLISGPTWAEGRVSDATITAWARSEDRWWRRAALVSTVAISRRGRAAEVRKVTRICRMLEADRDDMVVKAVSWALRELAKKQPDEARRFLEEHRQALAARVIRELENKLRTGLKNPR